MSRGKIGALTGIALTPGVSKNGRYYPPDLIERAVKRMQTRLADPSARPITMLTHHGAGDDSTAIAGRITTASLDGNNGALFEATLADNDAGRNIAALVTPQSPYLRNVSIRGWWLGQVRQVEVDGQMVETADDLEIDGVDFTKSPGVAGAVLTSGKLLESSHGRTLVYESVADPRLALGSAPPSDPRLVEAAVYQRQVELAELSASDLRQGVAETVLAPSRPSQVELVLSPFWASFLQQHET
ncbi:MAG: hypothetical protein JWM02_3510 [Frankiales bacterium]|nr:hypothetical protein [Frankiales bacterium]